MAFQEQEVIAAAAGLFLRLDAVVVELVDGPYTRLCGRRQLGQLSQRVVRWNWRVHVARADRRAHPAWMVAGVAFLALMGAAGFRAAPSVMTVPMQEEFGWSQAILSAAVAVNLLLFATAPGTYTMAWIIAEGDSRTVSAGVGGCCAAVSCLNAARRSAARPR